MKHYLPGFFANCRLGNSDQYLIRFALQQVSVRLTESVSVTRLQGDSGLAVEEPVAASPDSEELRQKLEQPVSALELSVRAYNCLDGEDIKTIGELVAWKESDLLKVRNFGKTTLVEIKAKLEEIGLSLGMEVPALEGSAGGM